MPASQPGTKRRRVLIVAQDDSLRAHLAHEIRAKGHAIELADGISHARRFGLHQLDLAIIALEGLGSGAREFVGELEAQMPTLLWTPAATVAIQDQVAAATCPPEEPEPGPLLRFADYTLDVAAHSLTNSDGTELPLTRGEFSLLLEFVRRPGRVQSRDMLLHALAGRS
jgi:DNA-binding response OmpR family regulator